jgi:putative sigma-54 modulation protein
MVGTYFEDFIIPMSIKEVFMFFQFTFKKMDPSDSLVRMAIDKLESRIQALSGHCINPHLTFSSYRGIQKIHFSMLTQDGFRIEVSHSGPDMYAELDEVVDRIESQLRKHKERLREHKGQTGIRAAAMGMPSIYRDPLWDDVLNEPKDIDAGDIMKFEAARQTLIRGQDKTAKTTPPREGALN